MPDAVTPRPLDFRGVAGTVVCCALWGGNAVAVKYAVPDLPPVGCAAIRFLIALPIVALLCRQVGETIRVKRSLWWLLGVHGLLAAAQIGTFNLGTSQSLAGRAAVFINVHPLLVAPLAWVWLGERLGSRGLAGLGAAVCGVVVLLAEPFRRGAGSTLTGDLIVLGSGVIFAFQTIAQKKTFPLVAPTTLLFSQTAVAFVLSLAYSSVFEGYAAFHFTQGAVGGVLFQGLAVSGVCFTLWMILLRRYPAGRLATVAFLTPLFGVAFGSLTRGEPLSLGLMIGGVLVGLGIYLVATDRTAHGEEPDIALPGEDAP